MEEKSRSNYAVVVVKDAQTELKKESCTLGMEKRFHAVKKGAQIVL